MFPLENEYKSLLPRNAHGTFKAACTIPLIQEGQMSVSGESMCTSLERISLPRNSVVRLTGRRYMTEILLIWHKTPTQTNKQISSVLHGLIWKKK